MEEFLPKIENPSSMNERETIEFLATNNVELLSIKDFKPSEPLLYVFEEMHRGDFGPFGRFGKDRRPSVVRVNNPVRLYKRPDEVDGVSRYELDSNGQIDYFYIKPNGEVVCVRTSQNRGLTTYHVHDGALYKPKDALFPPSNI